jgi:hypothetical protein
MRYFKVSLYAYQDDKIQSIKTIREVFNLGLKEAKDFVDDWWSKHSAHVAAEVILNEVQLGALLLERHLRTNTDWGITTGSIVRYEPVVEPRNLSLFGYTKV